MKSKYNLLATAVSIAITTLAASPAQALDKGDWLLRVGVTQVRPNVSSDTTPLVAGGEVDVKNGTSLSINLGYMLTPNVALDILGAWPFKHDIIGAGTLSGAGTVAEVKQLPPTVGLQYHFSPKASVRPYVGAGINYTTFFSIHEKGVLTGDQLKLSSSWGLAAQAGVDFDINKKWFANVDVRYVAIKTEAESATTGKFDVKLNPWVVGISLGTTF